MSGKRFRGILYLTVFVSAGLVDKPALGADALPVIISAIPDTTVNPTQLTIQGLNLGPDQPQVSFNGVPLTLSSFTPTMVVAFLPANLRPGSYLLSLTTRDRLLREFTVDFDVTLGAVGPKGDQSLPGPQGVQGPRGLQ